MGTCSFPPPAAEYRLTFDGLTFPCWFKASLGKGGLFVAQGQGWERRWQETGLTGSSTRELSDPFLSPSEARFFLQAWIRNSCPILAEKSLLIGDLSKVHPTWYSVISNWIFEQAWSTPKCFNFKWRFWGRSLDWFRKMSPKVGFHGTKREEQVSLTSYYYTASCTCTCTLKTKVLCALTRRLSKV